MNIELIKKIRDQVAPLPDTLDMSSWQGAGEVCGTTRCIAGWAIHLTTGESLYAPCGANGEIAHHPSVTDLARRLGVLDRFEEIAAALLQIDVSVVPFYISDRAGLAWLDAAARGDEERAREIVVRAEE